MPHADDAIAAAPAPAAGASRRRMLAAVGAALVAAGCGTRAPGAAAPSRDELLLDGDRRIHVRIDGSSGAPPVVLLPSSQRDSLDFDDFAQRLSRAGNLVLRPQPRGMGRSSPPPPGMTLATLASDVALTIERLGGGRRAVVVGHAYGHWVARVADMNHPALVRGVVVLGASARVFPPGTAEALAIGSDPGKPEADRLAALQRVMFAPGNDPRPWLEGWYPQWRAAYRSAGQQPPKDVWFGRTNSPILDLQGAQDPWRPPASRRELADVLPGRVTVRVIEGASHALVPERPAEVTAAIVEWMAALPPG